MALADHRRSDLYPRRTGLRLDYKAHAPYIGRRRLLYQFERSQHHSHAPHEMEMGAPVDASKLATKPQR